MDTIELTFTTEDSLRERKVHLVRNQVTHWYMSFDEQDHTIVCFGPEHVRVAEPVEVVTELLKHGAPQPTATELFFGKPKPAPVSLAGPQTCDVCGASTPGTLTALASGWHPTHSLMWGKTLYPRGPLCPRCAILSRGDNDGIAAGSGPVLFAEDLGDDTRHKLRSSIVQRTGTDPETGTDPRD